MWSPMRVKFNGVNLKPGFAPKYYSHWLSQRPAYRHNVMSTYPYVTNFFPGLAKHHRITPNSYFNVWANSGLWPTIYASDAQQRKVKENRTKNWRYYGTALSGGSTSPERQSSSRSSGSLTAEQRTGFLGRTFNPTARHPASVHIPHNLSQRMRSWY